MRSRGRCGNPPRPGRSSLRAAVPPGSLPGASRHENLRFPEVHSSPRAASKRVPVEALSKARMKENVSPGRLTGRGERMRTPGLALSVCRNCIAEQGRAERKAGEPTEDAQRPGGFIHVEGSSVPFKPRDHHGAPSAATGGGPVRRYRAKASFSSLQTQRHVRRSGTRGSDCRSPVGIPRQQTASGRYHKVTSPDRGNALDLRVLRGRGGRGRQVMYKRRHRRPWEGQKCSLESQKICNPPSDPTSPRETWPEGEGLPARLSTWWR